VVCSSDAESRACLPSETNHLPVYFGYCDIRIGLRHQDCESCVSRSVGNRDWGGPGLRCFQSPNSRAQSRQYQKVGRIASRIVVCTYRADCWRGVPHTSPPRRSRPSSRTHCKTKATEMLLSTLLAFTSASIAGAASPEWPIPIPASLLPDQKGQRVLNVDPILPENVRLIQTVEGRYQWTGDIERFLREGVRLMDVITTLLYVVNWAR